MHNFVAMLFFLDIDGVMVPAKAWKSPELMADGFPTFSKRAIAALQNTISVDDTVMLTTSHKANYSIEEWKSIFKNRAISIHHISTLPENRANLSRKEEILNWFHANKVNEDFIIIDDDASLHELPEYLKANWIQTSPMIGLTDEHVAAINARHIVEEAAY
jgi:hypothetical protein